MLNNDGTLLRTKKSKFDDCIRNVAILKTKWNDYLICAYINGKSIRSKSYAIFDTLIEAVRFCKRNSYIYRIKQL